MKVLLGTDEFTVKGEQLAVGSTLDSINVCKAGSFALEPVQFTKGKKTVLATYPSVDTTVCDMQVLELGKLSQEFSDVEYYGLSLDLPSALAAYKAMHPTGSIVMCSDYLERENANKLGLLIDELKLFARSIFVLDEDNKVIYREIMEQTADQVNFAELRKVLSK